MALGEFAGFGVDPFAEIRRMQAEMNRLFSGFGVMPATQVFPPVNLWVGDDSVVMTAELPGLTADDIDMSVQDDVLTLRGERKPRVDGEEVSWHRRERVYGSFARAIQLPFRVDASKCQARFHNGVLEVELHRPEADRPRKIQVRTS